MQNVAASDMHDGSVSFSKKFLEDSEIASGGLGVDLRKVARLAGGASEAPGGVEEGVGSRGVQRRAKGWTRSSASRAGMGHGCGLPAVMQPGPMTGQPA